MVVWAGRLHRRLTGSISTEAPPVHGAQGTRLCLDLPSPWGDSQQWTAAGPPGKWQAGLPP